MLNILQSKLRLNPLFLFVPRHDFTELHRTQFSDLLLDDAFAGLLVPQIDSGLAVVAVSTDSAQLFRHLEDNHNLLPVIENNEQSVQSVLRMLVTGILEVSTQEGFVSGELGLSKYIDFEKFSDKNLNHIQNISLEAIKYAQNLTIDDTGRLSARIYFYNRHPIPPNYSARRLHELGSESFHSCIKNARLSNDFKVTPRSKEGWLYLTPKQQVFKKDTKDGMFKLYISPNTADLLDCLSDIAKTILSHDFIACKIGIGSAGLMRPDKLILYCHTLEKLKMIAKNITPILEGCSVHGVPFSTDIYGNGLLSWGVDPVPDRFTISWLERESWRLWLTNRIAASLLFARKQSMKNIEPWQYVLARLEVEGVDTTQWSLRRFVE